MSNVVHEPTAVIGMIGVSTNHETYCMGNRCMSWEGTIGKEMLEGYCKLLEEKQC